MSLPPTWTLVLTSFDLLLCPDVVTLRVRASKQDFLMGQEVPISVIKFEKCFTELVGKNKFVMVTQRRVTSSQNKTLENAPESHYFYGVNHPQNLIA